ncbi:hypothetical protein [Gemmatimonas sp.]|uniref:hypothetical protein n=1 Tax=Gemmatimonas sp. TaxID=1962908 RepID=UPI003561DA80
MWKLVSQTRGPRITKSRLMRCTVAASLSMIVVAACSSDGGTNRAKVNDGVVDIETDTLSWDDIDPNSRATFCEGYRAVSLEAFRQIIADRVAASDIEALLRLAKENC